MLEDFTKQIIAVTKYLECKFYYQGKVINETEAFAYDGLLPGLMKKADQIANFCLGYDLGVEYSKNEKSLIGFSVKFNQEVPNAVRLLCAVDALVEIIQSSSGVSEVHLDALREV